MGIAIAVLVVLAIAVVVGISLRRSRAGSTAEAVVPPRVPRPEPEPMTDLEDALAQVTDRSGTSLRDRLESTEVDDLRVIDDTGPLLRRALDHVEPVATDAADATGTADSVEPSEPDAVGAPDQAPPSAPPPPEPPAEPLHGDSRDDASQS